MNRKSLTGLWMIAAAITAVSLSNSASAQTLFGSLSNFDMINDTNQVCHGFEIELDGVTPADISYTFGSPYIRYGDPVKINIGTGTIVRYASAFSAAGWAVGTPFQDPAHPVITGGHQLFDPAYGGDPNYFNLPGDHFGVALNGNPTNTIYRWLLDDGTNTGTLAAAGTNVKIPAPVWNVTPAANPAVAPAAVQAVIPALPKEHPEDLFGEAIWVKVFVTESHNPVELNHLLVGDPGVPDGSEPAEVEVEWQLLQAGKDALGEVDSGLNDMGAGSESVTRRYEFYKYVGAYDAEGEALIENASAHPEAVGEFLGAQNAAINLAPFEVPEPGGLALLGVALASAAGSRPRRRKAARA